MPKKYVQLEHHNVSALKLFPVGDGVKSFRHEDKRAPKSDDAVVSLHPSRLTKAFKLVAKYALLFRFGEAVKKEIASFIIPTAFLMA
ncbi:hypothetical protein MTO96_020328 [Rhipicephalus appendiculatus]